MIKPKSIRYGTRRDIAGTHHEAELLELGGSWEQEGYQVGARIRRPRKRVPWFAESESILRHVLLQRPLQKYRVAYMYWLGGYNAGEIADDLKMTRKAAESIIAYLKRVLDSPAKKGRGRGRKD